jgi:hypothetical protein
MEIQHLARLILGLRQLRFCGHPRRIAQNDSFSVLPRVQRLSRYNYSAKVMRASCS